MNRIEEQFKDYQKKVVPEGASKTQNIETRRAFYAGAQAMMTICKAVGSDRVPATEGEQILEDADRELRQFCKLVMEGKA